MQRDSAEPCELCQRPEGLDDTKLPRLKLRSGKWVGPPEPTHCAKRRYRRAFGMDGASQAASPAFEGSQFSQTAIGGSAQAARPAGEGTQPAHINVNVEVGGKGTKSDGVSRRTAKPKDDQQVKADGTKQLARPTTGASVQVARPLGADVQQHACFICLEVEGFAGEPPLAHVCACMATRVHQTCLQSYLNSDARRALHPRERTRCPVCSEHYRVHAAPKLPEKAPVHCWKLVHKRNLALGVSLLLLFCVLTAALFSKISLISIILIGMLLIGTGCLTTMWAVVLPQLAGDERAREESWLVISTPQDVHPAPAAAPVAEDGGSAHVQPGASKGSVPAAHAMPEPISSTRCEDPAAVPRVQAASETMSRDAAAGTS